MLPAASNWVVAICWARVLHDTQDRNLELGLEKGDLSVRIESRQRELSKIYKRRDRYEIPEWQRQEVWGRSKRQNLIDSILKGWKLPKFYLLKTDDDPEQYEVVDGQQRLLTIFEFFDNGLGLPEASAAEFGGEFYRDLSDRHSDAFDDFEIEIDVIEDASESEVRELFQRLQEGLPLTSSEKLNSIHSKLRNFVAKLSTHSFMATKTSVSDKRYGHFDVIAKAAAIEIDGLDAGVRYDDLRSVFESQAGFSSRSNVAKRLKAALDFLDSAFPTRSKILRNRTVVQSLITLGTTLAASGVLAGSETKLAKFFEGFMKELTKQVELGQQATDSDYVEFQRTVNANLKSGPATRHAILLRKLLQHDPSLVSAFAAEDVLGSGFQSQINRHATSIRERIASLNEHYAATHGDDLFKPTNKTALAQSRLASPVKDLDGYRSLIDDLYFVFHEGVGNRLGDSVPKPFADINALRTSLRHDVDHGKKGNVKKKRKSGAAAFRKYGGSGTPETASPEVLLLVQANLLAVLEAHLAKLAV
jgi:hypothetical protein